MHVLLRENLVHFVVVDEILVHLLLRGFDPFLSLRKFGAIVKFKRIGTILLSRKFISFHGIWNNFCGREFSP